MKQLVALDIETWIALSRFGAYAILAASVPALWVFAFGRWRP